MFVPQSLSACLCLSQGLPVVTQEAWTSPSFCLSPGVLELTSMHRDTQLKYIFKSASTQAIYVKNKDYILCSLLAKQLTDACWDFRYL